MNTNRQLARTFLNNAPLTTFWDIVKEAKITDDDQKILDEKFVHGKSYIQIAETLHISPEKVKLTIQKSYDKIARLL